MPRGEGQQIKVFYQGSNDDFIVFAESAKAVKDWKADKSIALAQVVESFQIFVTNKHGAQGQLTKPSKAVLESEFGSSNDDECIKHILEKGSVQMTENSARGGDRNETMGSRQAHGSGNH